MSFLKNTVYCSLQEYSGSIYKVWISKEGYNTRIKSVDSDEICSRDPVSYQRKCQMLIGTNGFRLFIEERNVSVAVCRCVKGNRKQQVAILLLLLEVSITENDNNGEYALDRS